MRTPCLSSLAAAVVLVLAARPPVLAQGLSVGKSVFRSGQEILYSGGPSQGPQTKEVGIGIELGFTSSLDEARLLVEALDRLEEGTCDGTQVRLEVALRRRAKQHDERSLPELGWNLLQELRDGGLLEVDPNDPEAGSGYSWWNYQVSGDQVRCQVHGSYRERLEAGETGAGER